MVGSPHTTPPGRSRRITRVMSRGVYLLEPAPPLVRHTVITSQPARAHLASVPPTVNSWSSGCAWMLIARLGAGGSFDGGLAGTDRGPRRRARRRPPAP